MSEREARRLVITVRLAILAAELHHGTQVHAYRNLPGQWAIRIEYPHQRVCHLLSAQECALYCRFVRHAAE